MKADLTTCNQSFLRFRCVLQQGHAGFHHDDTRFDVYAHWPRKTPQQVRADAELRTIRWQKQSRYKEARMTSRKDIHAAIQRRGEATLRQMAQRVEQEQTRMFLDLLTDFVERDVKTLKKAAA